MGKQAVARAAHAGRVTRQGTKQRIVGTIPKEERDSRRERERISAVIAKEGKP